MRVTYTMGNLTDQLNKLVKESHKIARGTLGAGAGKAAEDVSEKLNSMPVRPDKQYGTANNPLYGATASEKRQIIDNFGIAKFNDDGSTVQTSVGFSGYVNTPSKKYNDQIPTGMLMQCIEDGTSFRRGWHGIRNAVKAKKVTDAMQDYFDEQINEITG